MCLDGAHLRTLQMFFGTDVMHYGVTSSQFGGETRFFDRFSQPLEEIVGARIWAGLHYRTADVQGRDLGINVANYMVDNYFQPVGKRGRLTHELQPRPDREGPLQAGLLRSRRSANVSDPPRHSVAVEFVREYVIDERELM